MTTEDLDALIARRDELKGKIDMHLRFDPGTDAPGDDLRDELQQTIGAITTALHAPYEREAVRLRQQRAELAQELQAARDHWTQLRCAHGASQGHRSAALAAGRWPLAAGRWPLETMPASTFSLPSAFPSRSATSRRASPIWSTASGASIARSPR